jgi:hypothetical protein
MLNNDTKGQIGKMAFGSIGMPGAGGPVKASGVMSMQSPGLTDNNPWKLTKKERE